MVLLIWQNEALFLDSLKTQSADLMRMLCSVFIAAVSLWNSENEEPTPFYPSVE